MGFLKKLLDRWSSPMATAEALMTQYGRFERLPESERLLKVFTTRGGWKEIPEETLRRLVELLAESAESHQKHILEVIEFVVAGEVCKVDPILSAPGQSTSERLDNAAMALALRSDSMTPEWRPKALEFARRLAPDNGFVIIKQALWHYERGEFKQAVPLFQRGIELVEKLHEFTKQLTAAVSPGTFPEKWKDVEKGSDIFLIAVKAMYADCQEKAR
jgi:hypothetical protein